MRLSRRNKAFPSVSPVDAPPVPELATPSIRQSMILGALWALGSFALLLFRSGYPFPAFNLLDGWFYTAYQWDLRGQIADFGPTYYGSRLSWILPGVFLHQLFTPATAEIMFKLLFSALFSTALVLIVQRTAGFRWALLGVVVAVLTPQVVTALNTDYVDTAVFTFATTALACIVLARDSRCWAAWIAAGGAALACMLVANLGAAATIGAGLACFHLVWLRWRPRRTLAAAVLYLIGASAALAVMGAASVGFGGPFLFLTPQINMLRSLGSMERNPWMPNDYSWVWHATWLILPAGAFVQGAVASFTPRLRSHRLRPIIQALTLALGLSLSLGIVIETRGTGGVLSLYYYASYYLTFALPLLVVWVAAFSERSIRWHRLVVAFVGAGLIAMAIGFPPVSLWRILAPLGKPLGGTVYLPVALSIVVLLALGARILWPERSKIPRTFGSAAGAFALLLFSTPDNYHGAWISDRLRERYLAVHSAYTTLAAHLAPGSYRYWIEANNPDSISLASTKLWGYRLFTNAQFPAIEAPWVPAPKLVVPLPHGVGSSANSQARQALDRIGYNVTSSTVMPIVGANGIGFDLLVLSVHPRPFDPEHPGPTSMRARMLAGYEYYHEPPYTSSLRPWIETDRSLPSVGKRHGYPFLFAGHLVTMALPYQVISPPEPGQTVRTFSLVTVMPAPGDCVIGIVDQYHRQVGELTLTASGREVHAVNVPGSTTAFRLTIRTAATGGTPLPTNINVYEVKLPRP